MIGPSLAGVVGRKSGSAPGFNYSPALKAVNITWDEQTLDTWLRNPMGEVHGSRMVLTIPHAADRQIFIAYLETLK
jgi:cytochrome c